jgi:glyoxylase-like metal-dependent hydrolase (beta-lactamase superfamily II)
VPEKPLMTSTGVYPLDLKFMGRGNAIAAYLFPHPHGAALIECGPGSTEEALLAGLAAHGFSVSDVTDVLLTHIHLDHAGAAGWLARQGARIHVHRVGAPHMLNPEKLLSSAQRIYGDMMDKLWGEFLSVPEERLSIVHDGDVIELEGLRFCAVETLGHANHHFAYLHEGTCFCGDVGGVRMPGVRFIRLPVPPPELNLELWRESIRRLKKEYASGAFQRIAPTHFGIFDDAGWHLTAVERALDELDDWITEVMPPDPPLEQLNTAFLDWSEARAIREGLKPETIRTYELVNPSWMAAAGIQRYWKKHRVEGE